MAAPNRKQSPHHGADDDPDETRAPKQPRPFWSGIIAFGLVSLPVSLFPANRGKAASLKMVDSQGNPVRRRYYCEKENRPLERDEMVRGYPVAKNQFVIVEDDELEALAPEKTREIDLKRFVPQGEVNPVFFERGYFLAPDTASTKAYRLLARSMEEEQRVGIATFVMRDKEYIIAIMSEQGILRAETLRFHDEIRTPDQVGLPELTEPSSGLTRSMEKAMQKHAAKSLDPRLLRDQQTEKLQDLIKEKLESGTDLITQPEEPEPQEDNNVVDLIQVLKDRLNGKNMEDGPKDQRPKGAIENVDHLNRDELYEEARKQQISGRSKMNKDELIAALRQAG